MSPNSAVDSYLNQDKESVTSVNSVDIRSINWKEDLREKAIRCVIEDDDERLKRVENAVKSSCLIERLISDIIEMAKIKKKIEGFLITMDIEKAFDSLDHKFLISALEKYGFGKNFISWVKILLRNQESYVLNGGTTTKHFLLE